MMQSIAMAIQAQSPAEAHALAPSNGVITSELAAKLASPKASAQDGARSVRLARLALRQDPTVVDAAVTLALNALIRSDTSTARRLFAYSETLSRRNLPTQLWNINDPQNGVSAVLLHYDIALRTSRDASTLLFPVLASAIADPTLRTALTRTLARRPAWAASFIDYVAGNGADPQSTAALFEALSHYGVSISDQNSATLINKLISAGKPRLAWSYYAAIHSGAARHLSRDPTFENFTQTPSPFDWTPANDRNISASIQPDGHHGGVLTFAAPSSIGGQIVRQIEMLPPGDYILKGRSEGIDQANDARPYWSLSCNGGRELGRVDLPNSTVANGFFQGRFTVPADCPVQVLALNIRPSSNVFGITGQIDRALLRPAR